MIVMKFGGTSVQDEAAIERVIQAISLNLQRRPVVVLSAMGQTTNRLLEIARAASQGELDRALSLKDALRELHVTVAERLVSGARLREMEERLEEFFTDISSIIQGLYLLGECSARSLDAIASFGERMSTWVVAQALREKGFDAVLLDSRKMLRTDDRFTQATVLVEHTYPAIRQGVAPSLEKGKLVVVQGFIGSTLEGVTTTIGRGGSDYSAALFGAALQADDIQIWTDVPGILTTDPRIVPRALKIKAISFAEAAELAYFGAKVLHPSTLLPAVRQGIPVHVCSSVHIDRPGTSIHAHSIPSRSPVKAIAGKKGITVLNVTSTRMLMAHGFLRRLFEVFDRHETVVDVVATTEVSVSVTIDSTEKLDLLVRDLSEFGEVDVESNLAIICAVGDNLKETPGIAGRIFGSLASVNVRMISQGASRINVTFLVREERMEEAVRHLHDEFFRNPDPELFEVVAGAASVSSGHQRA